MLDRRHTDARAQDKAEEIAFFSAHGAEYDVFTAASKARLIAAFTRMTGLPKGARVADLGCGSGVFTDLLRQAGYDAVGVDICPTLIGMARAKYSGLEFIEGDIEALPFPSESLDGVLLSGVLHHFPDPSRCAAEVRRVLRRGGRVFAFDPNRMNPFMWLYRDPASPFYSPIGVTANERPLLARDAARVFGDCGFRVQTDFLSGLAYRYVASTKTRALLPVYNLIDATLFNLGLMRPLRAFVLTCGEKL